MIKGRISLFHDAITCSSSPQQHENQWKHDALVIWHLFRINRAFKKIKMSQYCKHNVSLLAQKTKMYKIFLNSFIFRTPTILEQFLYAKRGYPRFYVKVTNALTNKFVTRVMPKDGKQFFQMTINGRNKMNSDEQDEENQCFRYKKLAFLLGGIFTVALCDAHRHHRGQYSISDRFHLLNSSQNWISKFM